jgi:hypothetical protein
MLKTAIGAAAVLTLALAPASALAQDDTMGTMVPHPSHIHAGDCSMPGDVVVGLSDVGVVGNDAQGAESHIHVDIGRSTVELPLEAILAEDHSIMVHESAGDGMSTILVCGAIGGHDVDGSFLVGLGPVGASGYSGIAWLKDNGDGTTDVQVTISHSGATESMNMAADDMAAGDMSGDDMSGDDMDGHDMDSDS